jgi:hypothetical protein
MNDRIPTSSIIACERVAPLTTCDTPNCSTGRRDYASRFFSTEPAHFLRTVTKVSISPSSRSAACPVDRDGAERFVADAKKRAVADDDYLPCHRSKSYGTLITMTPLRNSSAPLIVSAVWLCNKSCHHFEGINSGRITESTSSLYFSSKSST